MQKINLKKLKRDCFIAVVIPITFLGLYQVITPSPVYETFGFGAIAGLIVCWYLYKFFTRLEDMTWHQQVSALIEKVSAPVFIADAHHQITYANDSFNRLPLATLLSQLNNLAEILADSQGTSLELQKDTLSSLSGKIKFQLKWASVTYEWVIVPLISPTGKHWGTLVECIEKKEVNKFDNDNEKLPLLEMVEHFSTPFLFLDGENKIAYMNLSLKMLFIREQVFVQNKCPELNVYEPMQLTLNQLITLLGSEESTQVFLDNSLINVEFGHEQFQLVLQKMRLSEESEGIFMLWQEVPKESVREALVESKRNIIEETFTHSPQTLILLDNSFKVQLATKSFFQLLEVESNENIQQNFVECLKDQYPTLGLRLEHALRNNLQACFIAEHKDKYYDWNVSPIQLEGGVVYLIEILSPSRQEINAVIESSERMHNKKMLLEKELTHFVQGLGKLTLYQNDDNIGLVEFENTKVNHVLLKNAIKIVQKFGSDLNKRRNEIEHLKTVAQSTIAHELPVSAPFYQVNVLSSSIVRNVHEVKHDFSTLYQELMKLKGLVKEQKGLTHAYAKPIFKTVESIEQALFQTVGYFETVTMVLHQLHENQNNVTQLQTFMLSLAKLPNNPDIGQQRQIYHEIGLLLDTVKQALSANKQRLTELLVNFESLKGCWNQALDNLKSCLHLNVNIEQAADRWCHVSEIANERSQQVLNRIQSLIDLTQKIQHKTNINEESRNFPIFQESHRQFDQRVIEVEDSKRKAEAVLLEGCGKI